MVQSLAGRLFTRRRLLRGSAQAASLAAAGALLPPNVQRLLAQSPRRPGSLRDIKHVVLLMQENRSFDHYFGTMSGVRGFGDPNALTLADGRSVFHQPDPTNPSGYTLPFRLDTFSTNAEQLPSTDHSWAVQHASWNGGRMDNWLPAHRAADGKHGPYTMGYFDGDDIPFHRALAEAFTICDAYHCSTLGPTRPNRLYYLTGTIDPENRHVAGRKDIPTNKYDALTWKTYPERLEEADVPWKFYQYGSSVINLNVLRFFRQFTDALAGSALQIKGMPAPTDGEFEHDALHDRLPAVSWLYPSAEAFEHPHNSGPARGAEFIARMLDAVAANPDVWAKTAFILNYDENDGLFDHVPPPVPPLGTANEFVDGVPNGAGFRVPCIIVSPWTTGGWVCSQRFDHTSIVQFLERFTGVREPNISDWRRRTFGDLTAAFRFGERPGRLPVLPGTEGALQRAGYAATHLPLPPVPGADQTSPRQMEGERRRTAHTNQADDSER
jgi:phospholipase C